MDWSHVIGELSALGYTQPAIAKECGCAQATISDLSRGATKNPSFPTGQALLQLLERAKAEGDKQKASA